MLIKLSAVIPTVQYGNLQPSFEVELAPEHIAIDPDIVIKTQEALESKIQALWDKYGEKPLTSRGAPQGKLIECFIGGSVLYDAATHTYTNDKGEKYLSGSEYAKQFEKPFDSKAIIEKMVKENGVAPEDVAKMWQMAGEISTGLGTAIHAGLELRGKYGHLADKFAKDYSLHSNPAIKNAVESFFDGRKESAEYEAMVVDHEKKRAGCIDRIVFENPLACYVEDFKTGSEIKPDKLKIYWKQLSFYAAILKAGGKNPLGLRIHHWSGTTWKTYEHEVEEVN